MGKRRKRKKNSGSSCQAEKKFLGHMKNARHVNAIAWCTLHFFSAEQKNRLFSKGTKKSRSPDLHGINIVFFFRFTFVSISPGTVIVIFGKEKTAYSQSRTLKKVFLEVFFISYFSLSLFFRLRSPLLQRQPSTSHDPPHKQDQEGKFSTKRIISLAHKVVVFIRGICQHLFSLAFTQDQSQNCFSHIYTRG